jgi:ATP adenylyltransferase/5',5'''-P-1,P-4-tetraphosphate phosphorylase II
MFSALSHECGPQVEERLLSVPTNHVVLEIGEISGLTRAAFEASQRKKVRKKKAKNPPQNPFQPIPSDRLSVSSFSLTSSNPIYSI